VDLTAGKTATDNSGRIETCSRPSVRSWLLPVVCALWGVSVGAQEFPAQGSSTDIAADREVGDGITCQSADQDESSKNSEGGESVCENSSSILLPEDRQQDLSEEVAENTQDARSLKRLLLGRSFSFFGRLEPEYAHYFNGVLKDEDDFDLRRLRAGLVGVLTDTLSYKGEFDLTDGSNSLSDFYLRWDTTRFGSLTVGNQRVAQNLSAMTSSLTHLFMEQPLPVTTFSLARRLGISQDLYFKKAGVHGVVFTRDPNNDAGDRGVSLRVVANPVRTDGGIAHVGFSVVREKMDRHARFRTQPESHVTDIRLVDTGDVADVDYQDIAGIEVAGAHGGFTARLEGFASWWDRGHSETNTFYGAYLELGHFFTGQHFRYKDGKFVRPVIEKGSTAWEAGVRLSWVDLDDKDVRGGIQKNAGVAINWYARRNIRVQFNLIYYDVKRDAGDENGWIAQTRFQWNW
jgi:phosphate-selective porin OprO/OprP